MGDCNTFIKFDTKSQPKHYTIQGDCKMATILQTDMSEDMQELIVSETIRALTMVESLTDDHLRMFCNGLANKYGKNWTCISNDIDVRDKAVVSWVKGNFIYYTVGSYSFIVFQH